MLGISRGYYDTLKFLHVVAVIAWVGGGIYAQALGTRALREAIPLACDHRDGHRGPGRLIAPVAIAALVFGVWLVAVSEWNFTDTWIVSGCRDRDHDRDRGGFLGPRPSDSARPSGAGPFRLRGRAADRPS